MAVKVFAYTIGELAKLEALLSTDRLSSYGALPATRDTLELYVWNTAPIHNKHPGTEYRRILEVADWIDRDLPRWIAHHARCEGLLEQVPVPRQMF